MENSPADSEIYVVDDDDDERKALKNAFNKIFPDKTIHFFSNGMELVLKLDKHLKQLPKLILIELYMPLMCGIETLKWIRNNKRFKTIPVIVYGTTATESEINRCYYLGANSFILKPSHVTVYENLVNNLKRYF
jgi:CheY-like chemotaxis protein